jgi:tRNA dimethylallyltransferase
MYRGLDIATAKVTPEEACGVPHHLLSFLDPQEAITVRQ